MILAKDDIEKAVSWWAGKLMDHQPHSNGDDSFTSVAVCFLADTMRQSVTLDQLNTFKAALAKSMHRDWFADSFCQPVYEAWFREAVCKGRIKAPGFLTNPAVAAAYMNCNWNGPARTNLNPKDEAEAAQMRVNSGFSTAAQETAQMTGGSYEANMRQRKAEAALKREVDEIAGAQVQQQTAVPQRSGGDPGKSE